MKLLKQSLLLPEIVGLLFLAKNVQAQEPDKQEILSQ